LAPLGGDMGAPPGLVRAHGRAQRRVHRVGNGVCVTVTPPPPSWAYRPDGSLKQPSEIHRHKDGGDQILFLNFEGAHITVGQDDPEHNQSGIPYSDVDFPAFDDQPFRDAQLDTRAKVIDAIVRWVTYFYAHMPVVVTSTRPPGGWPYTMMMVGGSPQVLGEQTGVLGIATFDCYKDPSNVGFVFSEDHGSNLEMLVLTITHEAGHTFGLAHIDQSDAIMYPTNPAHGAYWGTGNTPDSYACDNTTHQDSFAVLQEMLGVRDDVTAPWLEIETPGDGALVPSSLEVLVHGTDNVVLYRVELFLDDASVGSETLPSFAFSVSGLADGEHALYAVGEDAHGNTSQSQQVGVTVEANCAALAECVDGLSAVGAACEAGEDCQTGLCVQTVSDTVCSRPCVPEVNPCPFGTQCVAELADQESPDAGVASWCAVGQGPAELLEPEGGGARLSGCSAAGGSGGGDPTVFMPMLGLLLLIRRWCWAGSLPSR